MNVEIRDVSPKQSPPASDQQTKEPPPTAEELAAKSKQVVEVLFGSPAPEKSAAAEPEPVKPEVQTPTVAPAAATTSAPAVVPAPAGQQSPMSPDELIAKTAAAVGAEFAKQKSETTTTPTVATSPAEAPIADMTPEDRKDYETLLWLEQHDPKYAGKSAAFLDHVKAHYAYQDEFTKANPDKEFDPDDNAHADWYSKHNAPVSRDELDDAVIQMRVVKTLEEREKPKKVEQAIKEAEPILLASLERNMVEFINQVDPKIGDHFKTTDGKYVMDEAGIKRFEEADPIAKDILEDMVKTKLAPAIIDLENTAIPALNFKLDPANNPNHRSILEAQKQVEVEMLAAKPVRDGRQFIGVRQMAKLRNEAGNNKAKLAELDGYFTVTIDDVEARLVKNLTEEAKQKIDRENKKAEKKFGPPKNSAAAAIETKPATTATPTAKQTSQANPPSISSQSDVVTSAAANSAGSKSFGEQVASTLFG